MVGWPDMYLCIPVVRADIVCLRPDLDSHNFMHIYDVVLCVCCLIVSEVVKFEIEIVL
jgi:hypothetical protein